MLHYLMQLTSFDPGSWARAAVLAIVRSLFEGAGLLLLIPVLAIAGFSEGEAIPSNIVNSIRDVLAYLAIPATPASLLLLFMTLAILRAVTGFAYNTCATDLYARYCSHLRTDLYKNLSYANWGYLGQSTLSRYSHALTAQVNELGQSLWRVQGLFSSVITGSVGLFVSLMISPKLTFIALGVAAILGVAVIPFDRRIRKLSAQSNTQQGQLYEQFAQHIDGLKVAKSFNAEEAHISEYLAVSDRFVNSSLAIMRTNHWSMMMHRLAAAAALAAFVYFILSSTSGALLEPVLLIIVFARLVPHARTIQNNAVQIFSILPLYESYQTLMAESDSAAEAVPTQAISNIIFEESLDIQNLGFSYAGRQDGWSLKRVNIEIPVHQATAIIGPSGAGKTTLTDLLAGLVEPTSGNISVDSLVIDRSNIRAWRHQIGYVPQETFLTNRSIRHNVTLGKASASEEEIWGALTLAEITSLVRNLPDGLDTYIGDKGVQLSRGQGQRLALARALLTKPSVLILDEATSSLNPTDEAAIIETLQKLRDKVTMIIVAHRPSFLHWVDHIVILRDGEIEDQGSWQNIAARDTYLRAMIDAERNWPIPS